MYIARSIIEAPDIFHFRPIELLEAACSTDDTVGRQFTEVILRPNTQYGSRKFGSVKVGNGQRGGWRGGNWTKKGFTPRFGGSEFGIIGKRSRRGWKSGMARRRRRKRRRRRRRC